MADILDAPSEKNPRGIPKAPFVSKVEDVVKDPEKCPEILQKFQNRLEQYKYMETSKKNAIKQYKTTIPDIEKSLDMVRLLKEKAANDESIHTNYELNDTLYSQAIIEPTKTVCIWLGADIMSEYPIDEAESLLREKLESAKKNLEISTEDQFFLRENITTMEVNVARLYNYNVKLKRATD